MERAIPPGRMNEEIAFVRRQLDALSSQRIKYDDTYVPPNSKRTRRAPIANIVVHPPPKVRREASATDVGSAAHASSNDITLLVKSAKLPLSYTISASPTDSIGSLKAKLTSNNSGAPPPDYQRWIWSGKAMTDSKLLREYEGIGKSAEVEKIFLMIKSGWTPSQVVEIPIIQLEPVTLTNSNSKPRPALVIDTSSTETDEISPFSKVISDPSLWQDVRALLLARFGSEEDCREVWETWFGSSKHWLTPSQVAAVRDSVGITAMSGT